jgi:uncharacterized membrane protein HdeD (DUF308 family)
MKAETRRPDEPIKIPIIDVETLAHNWWVLLLRGIAGIIFGVLTFIWPEISLAALVLLFGAYAFADGVLALIHGIRERRVNDRWWVHSLHGILGIAAGIVTVLWPGITALALLYVIAAWALVIGALEIAAAIRLRKVIEGEWLLALAGIASVALGILLFLFPGPGALALVIWIGAYALVSGVLLTILAFRLRSWAHDSTVPHGTPHAHAH